MGYFLSILLLMVSLGLAVLGYAISIVSGKEGFVFSQLWIFLAIIISYLFLFALWYWLRKKFPLLFIKILATIIILFIAPPFLFLLLMGGRLIYHHIQGELLAEKIGVTHYQETAITWPGMSYPVGIHIEFEVPSPSLSNSHAYYGNPIIWMGPLEAVPANSYDRNANYPYAVLRRIFLNKQNRNPLPQVVSQGEVSKIVTNLYPGIIAYFETPDAFCTYPQQGNEKKNYATGSNLNALMFWQYEQKKVDVSVPFTHLLSTSSQFEGNRELWTKMHEQFEDVNLLKQGYHPCTLQARKHCFCK